VVAVAWVVVAVEAAVAATSVEWVECHAAASLVAAWALAARVGAVLIPVPAHGTAVIGTVAIIGTATIGIMGIIITAIM
jgi:hypothetical protein